MKTGACLALGRRRGGVFWGACLVVAMALVMCAVLSGCSSQSAKAAKPTTPPAVPVGVGTVKQGEFNVYLTGLGSVQALNTVSIKTRIDGQIMQVNFREGQDVRAGELLLVIDPRPYQVALDQAKANLAKDQAQLVNAKAQYDRNKVLYEQGVIAKQDLDTLEASFGTYEGTIGADKAAIENAQLNLTYCYIKSPVDGRVGLRMVDPGNYVTAAGGTAMIVVTQLHPISLVFTIPEHPSEDDDGLLTASEVAALKLNADWMVLSACNTAAGDKPGADGLSGLARAFFYAGARALLVSHWQLDESCPHVSIV